METIVIVLSVVFFLYMLAELFFSVTGLYRCPVCGKWVRLGKNATNCQGNDSWTLVHDGNYHDHRGGWHGLGAEVE